ncbi:MAG: hypothetical protein H8E55_72195 [Pelagibacterales bacterium]|nr:hypothetical protein [Pelagibacterales bacterium]
MTNKDLSKMSASLRYYYRSREKFRKKRRQRAKDYRNSADGKLKRKEWQKSASGVLSSRKASLKYQKTEKGSKKLLEYNSSKQGRAVRKKYYVSEKSKNWWKKHRKKINYKLAANMRKTLSIALSKNRIIKSKKTLDLLGCTIFKLKKHLKNKFKEGMTFENYGKWHIDHIKPITAFDLSDISQQKKCFNYKNLQPLWAKENIRKSNIY